MTEEINPQPPQGTGPSVPAEPAPSVTVASIASYAEKKMSPMMSPMMIFLLLALAVVGWLLAGVFGYSYKQVSDKMAKTTTDNSSAVSISNPVDVNGHIVYQTIVKHVHDVGTTEVQEKKTTVIKSGCAVGVAMRTNGTTGVYLAPEVLGLGPGNIQVMGLASKDELWGGVGYRLNF